MSDEHLVKKADIETDASKEAKLNEFRARAKQASPSSGVERVYAVFESIGEFKDAIASPLAQLSKALDIEHYGDPSENAPNAPTPTLLPRPPAFYAEPAYIGSHQFIGRTSQLRELSDWARSADPNNLLLLEAIGGNGKSILTWEWINNHAATVREDWAGRYWYSFYEKGAVMADFCQRALAYMTGRPLDDFVKRKTADLAKQLIAHLRAKPWLLVLDGLERVLVAYHRIDAAELPDDKLDSPTDIVADRNPRDTIRDEDGDLLRSLAAAAPSKLLISSRLTPRVFVNPSDQLIPGARRIMLPGLRPSDAERLLRSCGVDGNSDTIQAYLATNCDNHPLVIGILGGLVKNYLPARGEFDRWVSDPRAGANLELANLNLVQRRNHILRAALASLSDESRRLLSVLALISESVDYETLLGINPLVPPKPEILPKPKRPGRGLKKRVSSDEFKFILERYTHELSLWEHSIIMSEDYDNSPEVLGAEKRLAVAVGDLEQRGLLQYDSRSDRYELHPVVRSIAVRGLGRSERFEYGQKVVDHFSRAGRHSFLSAKTRDDLEYGIHLVRAWLHMDKHDEAFKTLMQHKLVDALLNNLEDYSEVLKLVRPFYNSDWGAIADRLSPGRYATLSLKVAIALRNTREFDQSISVYNLAMEVFLREDFWRNVRVVLGGVSSILFMNNKLKESNKYNEISLELARLTDEPMLKYLTYNRMFKHFSRVGRWDDATRMMQLRDELIDRLDEKQLASLGAWSSKRELDYVTTSYWMGDLDLDTLNSAEERAKLKLGERTALRGFRLLRGIYFLERGEWSAALESLVDALQMARESGVPDAEAETGIALAKQQLSQLPEPLEEAERLSQLRNPADRFLAQLWLALGETELAEHHALCAYEWALADGEPNVNRYELTKTEELLQEMQVPMPKLQPRVTAHDHQFPWEKELRNKIDKMRSLAK